KAQVWYEWETLWLVQSHSQHEASILSTNFVISGGAAPCCQAPGPVEAASRPGERIGGGGRRRGAHAQGRPTPGQGPGRPLTPRVGRTGGPELRGHRSTAAQQGGSQVSDQQSRPTQNPSLLTPSPTLAEGPPPLATGNEWVALPAIDGATGGVRTMEVLSMRALGSLGVAGSPDPWAAPGHSGGPAAGGESPGSASEPPPLLRPFLRVGDEAVALREAPAQVAWLADWVPRLAWEAEGLRLEATYCAPIGHRGWALQLAVTNGRPSAVEVAVGVEGRWASLVYSLFRSRPMPVTRTCQPDPWTGSLALEAAAGWPVLGWAIGAAEAAPILEVPPSADSVQFTLGRSLTLAPGATETATF